MYGAAYHQWFVNHIPNGDPTNIRSALSESGLNTSDIERILSVADADELDKALDQSTNAARAGWCLRFAELCCWIGSILGR